MPPDLATKIDQGLALLKQKQAVGEAPAAGDVSLATLAALCGCSKSTMRSVEQIALAKVHARLLADPEATALIKSLYKPKQTPTQPNP